MLRLPACGVNETILFGWYEQDLRDGTPHRNPVHPVNPVKKLDKLTLPLKNKLRSI